MDCAPSHIFPNIIIRYLFECNILVCGMWILEFKLLMKKSKSYLNFIHYFFFYPIFELNGDKYIQWYL